MSAPAGTATRQLTAGSPSATQALAGVLQRMGDVLGPGAIYSLVHYGAYEEGVALAAQDRPRTAQDAVDTVARILGFDARLSGGQALVVEFAPQEHIAFASGGIVALLVGLLEGMLTAALGSKVQANPNPAITRSGALRIELKR